MGVTPPPADPNAPGPFAFADEERLRGILTDAGFDNIDAQRFDIVGYPLPGRSVYGTLELRTP